MPPAASDRTNPDILFDRLMHGDRAALARAITLIESAKPEHRSRANALLAQALPASGNATRIGISGVPGVGKSTLIDALGSNLTRAGHMVAVLAVDPSSNRSGGSILGDKTRMENLSTDPNAFIRPSPTAGTLGGVAARTREAMILCEAAGFDVVIVETVGTGQSETAVADMVDCFVVLALPGAGDELQGIKKGIVELADVIAVNKADGENALGAEKAAAEFRAALHILTPASPDWTPPVITISGLRDIGLAALWDTVEKHQSTLQENGERAKRRRHQHVRWMWTIVDDEIHSLLKTDATLAEKLTALEAAVAAGKRAPGAAAEDILRALGITRQSP